MSHYEITVNKLHEVLTQLKDAGAGELFVVTSMHGGAPMPITEILCAPVGTRERYGNFIMSEEEGKAAPDDTPQVVVICGPRMTPCGWLSREFSARSKGGAS